MEERKVPVPYQPQVEAEDDCKHVDKSFLQQDVADQGEPESWKKDIIYQGFTYQANILTESILSGPTIND